MRYLLFSLLFISMLWSSCMQPPPAKAYKTGLEGKPLPAFTIQLLDSSSYIHSEEIADGKKFVLFYFSPTCPYCRAQMRDMVNNIEKFKDEQLYIITNADLRSIKGFARYFDLSRFNNVVVGRDTGDVVLSTYRLNTVPFTAYYDKNKLLKVAYKERLRPNSFFQY